MRDIAAFFDVSSKLARRAAGEPTERVEHGGEIRITSDDLHAARRAAEAYEAELLESKNGD